MHHLDHAGDAGRGLGVADVRLDRAEPQRAVARAPARRWPAAPAPRSDRRASCRCRAPRRRRRRPAHSPALASAWRITRSCDGPFGAVSPLLAPSWLTALPRTSASTRWPLRRASDSRSSTSRPTPSAQPAPSAAAANALQRPSGDSAALPAELDEDARPGQHGHAAGQRERALAARAAPGRPGAARPATTSRPCRPSPPGPRGRRCSDPAGRDAAGGGDRQVALDLRRRSLVPGDEAVVVST